jgi:hypothetical protein
VALIAQQGDLIADLKARLGRQGAEEEQVAQPRSKEPAAD